MVYANTANKTNPANAMCAVGKRAHSVRFVIDCCKARMEAHIGVAEHLRIYGGQIIAGACVFYVLCFL
jgi:hypothetical protein